MSGADPQATTSDAHGGAAPSGRSRAFSLISLLLIYPDRESWDDRSPLAAEASELASRPGAAVERFLAETGELDLHALQRLYVETFDFAKRSGLHLSYHRYGDRRERGMALVALKQRYGAAGLELAEGELPDYLPAMLEFAALRPEPGEDLLLEQREAIELVREALREEESPYAHLLDALRACLPRITPRQLASVRRLAAEGPPPDEMVGLEPFAPAEMMPAPSAPAAGADWSLPVERSGGNGAVAGRAS
jgi:nitrate reductase delta subunit